MGTRIAPLPLTKLCTQWEGPPVNWMDYFVQPKELEKLLTNPNIDKGRVSELTLEYLEQAMQAERDAQIMASKQMPEDDVAFAQRKSACLWLCTMACFAASEWDFERMVDEKKQNVHIIRQLIDRVNTWIHDKEVASFGYASVFSEFLTNKWILYVNKKLRTNPPAGKPCTNNPLTQEDQRVIRAVQSRRAALEVRTRAPEAAADIERTLAECRRIEAPSVECFLRPFIEGCEAYLSVGVLGMDVLVQGIPRPAFDKGKFQLPPTALHNTCRFELASYNFANLRFSVAKKYIQDLVSSYEPETCQFSLVRVNVDELKGFCAAFKLPPLPGTVPAQISSEKGVVVGTLDEELSVLRMRSEADVRGAQALITKADNLARECVYRAPSCVVPRFKDHLPQSLERFAHGLARLLQSSRDYHAQVRTKALLSYLCAVLPGIRPILLKVLPDLRLRELIKPNSGKSVPPPIQSILNGLCAADSPYWKALISFDPITTRDAVVQCGERFVEPYLLKFPEIFSEVVMKRGMPHNSLHAFLLGKQYQLCATGRLEEWKMHINGFLPLCDQLQKNADRTMFEVIRCASAIYNQRLRSAHCSLDASEAATHTTIVKNFYTAHNGMVSLANPHEFYVETLSYLLNVGEFKYIVELLPQVKVPYVTLCKLVGAWSTAVISAPVEQKREFAAGFTSILREEHMFESPGRSNPPPEALRNRGYVLQFLQLLTDQDHIALMVSYLSHLYNRVLFARKQHSLALDFQNKELWRIEEGHNTSQTLEFVEQCLVTILQAGLAINPTNAFWLRTLADYKYSKCDTEGALILYMEAVSACTGNEFKPPFPENVVNDLMWHRVRVCLSRAGCHTLSLLVSQLLVIHVHKQEQYFNGCNTVRTSRVADCGEQLHPFVFDQSLLEMLTEVYESTGQHHKTDIMLESMSAPCMNTGNPGEILARECQRRAHALLSTIAALVFRVHH